jgi:hypothetical protein
MIPASAKAPVFAVRGDQKIGAYAVQTDGSFAGAIQAFGKPSSTQRTVGTQACTAT